MYEKPAEQDGFVEMSVVVAGDSTLGVRIEFATSVIETLVEDGGIVITSPDELEALGNGYLTAAQVLREKLQHQRMMLN